jgi:chloramphenicol-sensitive protein RarD
MMNNKGIWYAAGAYTIWGLFPIYWKWLHSVSSLQLLGHRVTWSFLLLMGIILATRQFAALKIEAINPRVLRTYSVAAILIGINWLTYVWAVNAGHIIEASLGYFINPLVSVLLGVLFLRERLRPIQWLPFGLASIGVIYLTVTIGYLPWIALTLALSFGIYGLVKKTAPLGSLQGLTLETGILFIPALGYLIFCSWQGTGAFLNSSMTISLLLIGAGVVTTVPLLLFTLAARRIPLTMIGLMQYITPTMQFLLGVLVFKEPFSHTQLISFGIVWLALIIFWVENFLARRTVPIEPTPEMGEG